MKEAEEKGLTVYFGEDDHGPVYNFSIEGGDLTSEELEALVAELFYAPEIALVPSENKGFSFDELRVPDKATVDTKREGDITIVSARDKEGNVVRATQTAHYLIVTNREVTLTSAPPTSNACMKGGREFVRPADLRKLLPLSELFQGATLGTAILSTSELSISKNQTKLCW
jgi:hypothetical protein